MTREKLNEVLQLHDLWLDGDDGGCKADLREEDLIGENLGGFYLDSVDLRWAKLDYSCWSISEKSFGAHVDGDFFKRLAYVLCQLTVDDEECKQAKAMLAQIANQSQLAEVFGKIEIAPAAATDGDDGEE
ncbi:MAG: hypothetical protein ACRDBM_11960 [Sporomusa sp.]